MDFSTSIAVGCWRGRSNVSLLITKTEAVQFLQRLSLSEGDSKPVSIADDDELQIPDGANTDLESAAQVGDEEVTEVRTKSERAEVSNDQNEIEDT